MVDTSIFIQEHIHLPHLPEEGERLTDEAAIYWRFTRHLAAVPTSKAAIKVLSAIQFTADFLGYSDAHVSKVLVDLGLRTPREAFPEEFLDYVDGALPRGDWVVGGPSVSVQELAAHWRAIGEDPFAAVKRGYAMHDEGAVV